MCFIMRLQTACCTYAQCGILYSNINPGRLVWQSAIDWVSAFSHDSRVDVAKLQSRTPLPRTCTMHEHVG
jgi:hypothetical protein